MFARNCLNSSSDVVRYVANYGVYFGRMALGIGRNVFFGSENFSLPLNNLLSEELSNHTVVLCIYVADAET